MKTNHYNSHQYKSHFTFDQLVKLTIAYNKIANMKGAGLIKLVPNQYYLLNELHQKDITQDLMNEVVKEMDESQMFGGISKNCYLIHDNGGRPFMVCVDKKSIDIYQINDTDKNDIKWDVLMDRINPYKKIFIGDDPDKPNGMFKGNSILVQKNKHYYIFIGQDIYSFRPKDEIINYVSPVGNSDVPYPYAVGTENTYLMIENVMIANVARLTDDPYEQYYDHSDKYSQSAGKFKRFAKKMIHKR